MMRLFVHNNRLELLGFSAEPTPPNLSNLLFFDSRLHGHQGSWATENSHVFFIIQHPSSVHCTGTRTNEELTCCGARRRASCDTQWPQDEDVKDPRVCVLRVCGFQVVWSLYLYEVMTPSDYWGKPWKLKIGRHKNAMDLSDKVKGTVSMGQPESGKLCSMYDGIQIPL